MIAPVLEELDTEASASSDKTLDGSSANVVDGEISGTR
ncbi:hypothetical protein AB0K68_52470 [Streptomyces sp. NPDC050698]